MYLLIWRTYGVRVERTSFEGVALGTSRHLEDADAYLGVREGTRGDVGGDVGGASGNIGS